MRLDPKAVKQRHELVKTLAHPGQKPQKKAEMPVRPGSTQPTGPLEGQTHVLKWAQAALSAVLGLKVPVDGVLGGTTQVALKRFQAQAHLPVTGILDAGTLKSLAEALGQPHPPLEPTHAGLPWYLLERGRARQAQKPVAKKSQGPDDAWEEPPAQATHEPQPVEMAEKPPEVVKAPELGKAPEHKRKLTKELP